MPIFKTSFTDVTLDEVIKSCKLNPLIVTSCHIHIVEGEPTTIEIRYINKRENNMVAIFFEEGENKFKKLKT